MSGNSFVTTIKGIKYEVEFDLSSNVIPEEPPELENLIIKTDENLLDVLPREIVQDIERKCFEHLPDREPDNEDR